MLSTGYLQTYSRSMTDRAEVMCQMMLALRKGCVPPSSG